VDDLESLRKYHEQVSRSLEDQLGRLVESQQKTEEANRKANEESKLRMDRVESNIAQIGRELTNLTDYTRHAVELDIRAYRRERQRRRKEIRDAEERIAEERAKDRAEWLERTERIEGNLERTERNLERTERNLDRLIEGSEGRNGSNGSG